ncbi:MAG TPA: AI-2E family transporter [Candidatus Brocadiaceae bacterium]|nr:AI-2E family transporter [Candidatus Brocadiaceae bacterium]
MEKDRQKILENLWVRVLLIGFSIIIFIVLCYFLRGTIISLLLAFIVAYIFDPVVDFFERRCWPFTRKHIHRGFGIVFIIIAVLITTAGFLTYAIPKTTKGIYQVGSTIKKQYPKYETTIEAWVEKYGHIELAKSVESLMKERMEPIFKQDREKIKPTDSEKEAGIKEHNKQELSSVQGSDAEKETRLQKIRLAEILGGFKKYIPQVISFFMNIIKNIFYSTFGFLGILVNFIIFGVVSVYLLMDFNIIAQHIKTIFPLSKRDQATGLLSKVNNNLRYFLRGQLVICLILSLIYSIGLTIAGVPLSFLIGFIGGFGNLIPYVGTGTGIVLASALALFQFHDFKHIIYILITFGVGQILEGTVITPRIMGKGLGLSPVMVILSILICSQLLGFLGLLLAVPIASTVKVFIDEFFLKYKSSQYYKE